MKIYLIKHKGKTHFFNFVGFGGTMEIGKDKFYTGLCYFRKKDAKKYLESLKTKEYFEIVSAKVEQSKQDNRKRL